MSLNKPLRWGILGCGDVCEVKSGPAYQNVVGFELSAVMSRSLQKAKDFAQRHGIARYYDDASQLINDPQLDAIYIATPPDSHCEFALQVAAAGKICCVEKPMAVNFRQCQQMLEAFEAANLPLFVAYYRRSLPGFRQLKDKLDAGEIGQLRHLDWQFTRPPSPLDLSKKNNWRTQAEIAPGGYFDDIACHGLDIMQYLAGDIIAAHGITANQQGLYTSCDAISACFQYTGGATGTGNWNFASAQRQDKVNVSGSEGSLQFSIFDDTPALMINARGEQRFAMHKPTTIQQHFVQAMHDHLYEAITHPSLALSAARTNWVMDRILGIA
jgi:1,5-anhydro-D-fructose reductase (1,5-anhydro-D-mannitol-forming)